MTRKTQPARAPDDQLPAMPIALLEHGACTYHPEPDWWSSKRLDEREAAASICQRCPVLATCSSWAQQLPVVARAGVVLAGQYVPVSRRYDRQAS